MKLWLLKRKDAVDYDEYAGFVIRAETAKGARKTASIKGEPSTWKKLENPWLDPSLSSCKEIKSDGTVGIILSDFRAG